MIRPTISAVLLCGALTSVFAAATDTVEVKADQANLYADADTSSRVLMTVPKGTVLAATGATGSWCRVVAPGSGYHAWVRKGDLEGPPASTTPRSSVAPVLATERRDEGVAIQHRGVGCIVAEQFPILEARVEPADRVSRAQVFFHAENDPRWYFVEMKAEQGTYRGILPKPLKETQGIRYYIEALDRSLGETRTPEYSPIVAGSGECSKKAVLIATPVVKALVNVGGSAAGAPVPPGFASAGIAGATTPGAGAAVVSGAAAGGGGGIGTTALVIGGVAVAGGAVALVAATRGNDAATLNLTGQWGGSGQTTFSSPDGTSCTDPVDITQQITQNGSAITSVETRVTTGGDCNKLGRTRTNTFTGTLAGNTITYTIQAAAAGDFSGRTVATVSGGNMHGVTTISAPDGSSGKGVFDVSRR